MNCIIVDDDNTARLSLKRCVELTDFLHLSGTYENGIEARKALQKWDIDLVFLDIEMPMLNGFELLDTLEEKPLVVLVSSKKEYALEGFKYDVIDYLQKPVEYHRFLMAAERALKRNGNVVKNKDQEDYIFVKADSMLVRVNFNDIKFIEGMGDYVRIYTDKQRHTVLSTMKLFEKKLPNHQFLRIHKSYIVNIEHVNAIQGNSIPFGDKLIPISKSQKQDLMEKINMI